MYCMYCKGISAWRIAFGAVLCAGALMLLADALAATPDSVVVARVAGATITRADIRAGLSKLPDEHQRTPRQVLDLLVDTELLLLEARNRGLEQDDTLQARVERVTRVALPDLYEDILSAGITVSEEDIHAYYQDSGMADYTEVRARQIVTSSRAEAEALKCQLDAGADFAELARAHSIHRASAVRGGDMGYWEEGRHFGTQIQQVFALQTGEISGPHCGPGDQYYLLQKTDERPIGFAKQKPRIRGLLRRLRTRERAQVFLRQAKEDYGFAVHAAGIRLLLNQGYGRRSRLPLLDSACRDAILCTSKVDTFYAAEYVEELRALTLQDRPDPGDSLQVARTVECLGAARDLLPRALVEYGLLEHEKVQAFRVRQKRALLLEEVRRRVVEDSVATPARLQEYYRKQRELFHEPGAASVATLLTLDRGHADSLAAALRKGADINELAAEYALPGDLRNYALLEVSHKEVADTVEARVQALVADAAPGEIVGPVPYRIPGEPRHRPAAPGDSAATLAPGDRTVLPDPREAASPAGGTPPGPGTPKRPSGTGTVEYFAESSPSGQPGQAEGYLVIQLLDQSPGRYLPATDPRVREAVRVQVLAAHSREVEQRFTQLLGRLRRRYRDQIHIYPERLDQLTVPAGDENADW